MFQALTANPMMNLRWLSWIWPLMLLDLVLKGMALWKSAGKKEQWWFIALLVVNSLGILPAVYLLLHREQPVHKSK